MSDTGQPSAELPYATARLSGIGGRLRAAPADFVVEEIPAYQPCGEGEHCFLWIEKRDVSMDQLFQHLSHTLKISPRQIGTAGMKDRRAVTRQYVSVPASAAARLEALDTDTIRLLEAKRHRNKLRTGQLRGNRFSILLRDAAADGFARARSIQEVIQFEGVPNYFGPQRFGRQGRTLEQGLEALRDRGCHRATPRRDRWLRLSLSAVQSQLFNQILAERLRDGLLRRVLCGDVMQIIASGGPFVAEDVLREQERFDRREIVIAGPMFGPKMLQTEAVARQREDRVLAAHGLTMANFERFKRLARGTRRANLVYPAELQTVEEAEGIRFEFVLPPGSYATVLMREFMKSEH